MSETLMVEQSDEMFGVTPIYWEDSSCKPLSLVSDEENISLSHAKVYVFSDSVLCLGKMNQNPTSNIVWEEQLSQPAVDRDVYSARDYMWHDDKAGSSQQWKADKSMDDRTEKPVVASWARTHQFQTSFSHEKTKHVIWKKKKISVER